MMVGNNLKMKKMKKIILFPLFLAFILTACYDEYQTDYDFTAAYFSYQYPVRTVVMDPTVDKLEIQVGAAYGGKYSYEGTSATLDFTIDETLITTNSDAIAQGIKVMPKSWYTLSDESKIKITNSNVGFVNVTIKRDSLAKYPAAAANTYAIPFKLTGASTDSILATKDFSIVVVKFKNEFDGRYYVKGTDKTLNADGAVVSSAVYSNPSLVLNKYIYLTTLKKDMLMVPRVGNSEDGTKFRYNLQYRSSDGKGILSADPASSVTLLVGAAQYNFAKKSFICSYNYKYKDIEHSVVDTLIYSNTEFKIESWK